jgi:bacterioferritin
MAPCKWRHSSVGARQIFRKALTVKGDPQAIGHLEARHESGLTAIKQYFLHSRMLKRWGLDKRARREYPESIGEMEHADWLMARIFMIDGPPNLPDLGKPNIGENVPEVLGSELALELGAQAPIKVEVPYCETVRDFVSRDLLIP